MSNILLSFLLLMVSVTPKLLLVVEVARHGARAPFLDYLKNSMGITIGDNWDFKVAELTYIGERQLYLNGVKRRKVYIEKLDFLPEQYNPSTLYIESSDRNRTIMSANAQLLGFYPLGTGKQLDSQEQIDAAVPPFEINTEGLDTSESNPQNVKFQPIPVHVKHFHQGVIQGYEGETCPARARILSNDLTYFNEIYGGIDYVQKLYEVINTKLPVKRKINDFEDLCSDFNEISTDEELKDLFLEHFDELNRAYIYDYYNNDEFGLKLTNHNFFTLLHQLFADKMGMLSDYPDTLATFDVPKDRKYYLFSGDDTTITGILSGLSIWDADTPLFSSSLLIELHQDDEDESKFYVKVIYDDIPLMIQDSCDNKFLCDVDQFSITLSAQMLPKGESYEDNCEAYLKPKSYTKIIIIGVVIVILVLIAALLILYCCVFRAKKGSDSEQEVKEPLRSNQQELEMGSVNAHD